MRLRLCVWALLLGGLSAPAWAKPCKIDQIKSVVPPNDLIVTVAGDAYQPLGQDSLDPADWRPGEKVVICPNHRGPTTDGIFDLLNVDRNEMLVTQKQ